MNIPEIERALNGQVMLVDTREQDTKYLHYRLNQMGLPYEREALKFGDYSAKFPLPNGEWFSLADKCCIERKQDISELCANFCRNRERFEREFARASSSNARIYLLVENVDWSKILNHEYRSKMSPEALKASILAWLARYNCRLITCKTKESGILIRDILYREGKERLMQKYIAAVEVENETE